MYSVGVVKNWRSAALRWGAPRRAFAGSTLWSRVATRLMSSSCGTRLSWLHSA
jgi:hypothetical protein